MKRTRQRLDWLQQNGRAARGVRVFTQDLANQSIYRETPGGPEWTADALRDLCAAGWTVIKVEYVEKGES